MLGRTKRRPNGQRHHILVIEDDARLAEAVGAILADEWDVEVAHNADQALHQWEQRRSDLLVLDLQLSGDMDGIDIYQEIRRRSGLRPRAIVLSGVNQAECAARALGLSFIKKPFQLDDLIGTVRRVLEN
jgi:DNA-binding response OmpR family regulator